MTARCAGCRSLDVTVVRVDGTTWCEACDECAAVAAEHGIRFEGTGSDRSSRESVPVAVARAYVAAAEAAGRECSWAPDNDDPTQAWIYETEVTS